VRRRRRLSSLLPLLPARTLSCKLSTPSHCLCVPCVSGRCAHCLLPLSSVVPPRRVSFRWWVEAKATERDRRPLRMRHCSVAELLQLRTATLRKYSAGESFVACSAAASLPLPLGHGRPC
jgi:hypothetical protein